MEHKALNPNLAPLQANESVGTNLIYSILLSLIVLGICLGNRRSTISTYDTLAGEWLPLSILRGDGPYLDRFYTSLVTADGKIHYIAQVSRGHIVSRYPIGSVILALPLSWLQVIYLDWQRPGWDRDITSREYYCMRIAKINSAIIIALLAFALFHVLCSLGQKHTAILTVLVAILGSDLWTVASQASWQHGPAALMLTLLVWCLSSKTTPVSRWRLIGAGLAASALVACRSIDLVFPVFAVAWVTWHQPKESAWLILSALPITVALLGYNLWYFGRIEGGQPAIEALHPIYHHVEGIWTGNFLEGLMGTLFSPSRGLFIFSSWTLVSLLVLPTTAGSIRRKSSSTAWFLVGLIPYGIILSKYSVWWAGHSFGPRYWTDVIPLFAIMLAFALDWLYSQGRSRLILLPIYIFTFLVSIAIQVIGAFYSPSSWNLSPKNIDTHHERLWEWTDHELLRCVKEGRKPW